MGPWDIYLEQIDRVTPHLGFLARWVETLKRPKRILIVEAPIECDDGITAHFDGYRVQHNTSRGRAAYIRPGCRSRRLSDGYYYSRTRGWSEFRLVPYLRDGAGYASESTITLNKH